MILLQNIFHQFLPQILATLIKKYNSLKTLEDALVEQTRSAADLSNYQVSVRERCSDCESQPDVG